MLQQEFPLGDLLDADAFADACRSFAELYRVGVKVFDAAGHKLVDVKAGQGEFCSLVWNVPEGRAHCTATVGEVKGAPLAQGDTVTSSCMSGCRYTVAPIVYQGDVIGRAVLGPFLPEDHAGPAPELVKLSPKLDLSATTAAMQKVRRLPIPVAEKVVRHFTEIVEVLAYTGHKALLTSRLHVEAVQESYRELQERNRQLEDSNAALKELDRLKSNFLGTMSHELRTPLTSVIGYSEMMLEGLGGSLTKEQREYVQIIMEKGEALLHLISSILDVTKIESGRVRLVVIDLDPAELLRDAVSTVLPNARKKGITVSAEVGALPRVRWDREKIRQAVVNLLSNAVKFTPEAGRITLRVEPGGADRLAISIEDTGLGISDEHLPFVFDAFYQVDSSSTREFGGAGLGLAIVRSFAEAHGGKVQVRSKAGEGSTFTLTLPLRAAAAAQVSAGSPTPIPRSMNAR
ncbi:MAG TPA: ATP-binding protein [Anaeromyxobacteraceae bacterium]|nr:ATP-binding protein [Anaeromyxobacteraceae bacterium]